MLEEEGMLAGLYTDSSAFSFAGRVATHLGRLGMSFPQAKALASRVPAGIARERLFSSDALLLSRWKRSRDSHDLSRIYLKWGFQDADVVYSLFGEEYAFLRQAKMAGKKIVVDVFTHPLTPRIVADEASRCLPGEKVAWQWILDVESHSRRTFALADILLCPSEWVAEGVRDLTPEHAMKIRIIPYGTSMDVRRDINRNPRSGRILFVGRDPLRKGLHYLAAAANGLREEGLELDVRVAGVAPSEVRWIEHVRDLNILGDLPLNGMAHEYAQADLFVLPSLSEGQAGAVLESLGYGCPVVVTRECGFDEGIAGAKIVPARDVGALAESIRLVIENRPLRNSLAEAALRQAGFFTQEAWKTRLMELMYELIPYRMRPLQ